ncbi:MAG: NUDIX hydrolase [Verrucomicrobiota bacterium JB022]|nr:NUDIX hydrolase [Verrucomicrobiota bacterium JB022]
MKPSTPLPSAPPSWLQTHDALHAECRVCRVYRRGFRHPVRETEGDFFVFDMPDWVVALPVTRDRKVVLVQQFRFGMNALTWEFPAGLIDPGEAPMVAAQRELREETGYAGPQARYLGEGWPNPALQNNRCHFVLVEEAEKAMDAAWEPFEELAVVALPLDELWQWFQEGKIRHALAYQAMLLLMQALDWWPQASSASGPRP